MLSRRRMLAAAAAGAAMPPWAASAADADPSGLLRTGLPANDKCVWTLVRPDGAGRMEFQQYVLNDLAKAAGRLLPGASGVWVSFQDPNAFSGALVTLSGVERRIDAVLQITSSGTYVATDPVNSVLRGACGHVQGWRVHQSRINDSSAVPVGGQAPGKQLLWLNERLDGTTPEHYSRNWYIHGGHPDGLEADSEQSRANQARQAGREKGRWYIQNRVIEPITPTAWVLAGFSDYLVDAFYPGPGERYNPKDGMGEASFDKWPPKLFQGYTFRSA